MLPGSGITCQIVLYHYTKYADAFHFQPHAKENKCSTRAPSSPYVVDAEWGPLRAPSSLGRKGTVLNEGKRHMKIHLVDRTYELFRNHFGAPPRKGPDGREVGATLGLLRSLLQIGRASCR